ncbi:aspartyl-tRNA synthetase [Aulographum hederae CBS 113979]|uniref:Probable aspartate--tRNA ligase, cytoplasmic n=1 Tax=Aulographum hederae CBS 113979 TaxID=1176131 RepID=A0A6G1HGP6_9PEZI|nr:aspartyl-tRNA synthetase [Aulographum hederae CBS 113979]
MAEEEQQVPERPKEAPKEGEAGPSKNALKKAAKEKEKAEKKRLIQEREAAQKQAAEGNDVSKEDYGESPMVGSKQYKPPQWKRDKLSDTGSKEDGSETHLRVVVRNARSQSAKLAFLDLRDGLSSIQAVIAASETLSRQMVKFASTLNPESLVDVIGIVKVPKEPVKSATIQDREIHILKLFVVSKSESPLPIQIEDAERPLPEDEKKIEEQSSEESGRPLLGLSTRLDNRTLDLRSMLNHAIVEIKGGICRLWTEFMWQNDFKQIWTPKINGAPSEGGSNVFEMKYFNNPAYLAQSPQLYKQMMISARYKRVWELGTVFRAENSNTARHLTEFMGLDLEMEFQEHYHEVLDVLEELVLHIFNGLKTRYKQETDLVRTVYKVEEFKLPEAGKVPRLPFSEGITMLREAGETLNDYDDLSTPQEKLLGKLVLQKYNTDFYILDQFPLAIRPFYTMPSPHDPSLSNSYDMFMRGQEICSGAQRVHDAEFLKKRMRGMDPPLDPDSLGFKHYVEAFKYGCPPHAGGGFGLERIVMLWLGLPNVRLASLFPRDPGRNIP